jgi:poly-gamma-glutamate capsule biosynthesis protein CapA/YwtB (metallophosphatase superfamily)
VRRSMVVLAGIAVLVAGCASDPEGRPPDPAAPLRSGEQTTEQQSPPTPTDTFSVLATGDVLIHPALTEQAVADGGGDGKRDFVPLFAGIAPTVQAADLAICHLEVPLARRSGPFEGYPLFYAPPEVATALARTGYDTCSTASNHTFDHGAAGVQSTLDALYGAGIRQTGSASVEAEARTPLITSVNGVKVGQVSFTFGFNLGTEEPEPWMGNELSVDAVLAAARATKQAGAEVVIASLHWGNENDHKPTQEQRRIADALLADPSVDLIVGHHAHVVQPFEKLHGKWVAYGLGNNVARHAEPKGNTEEGVMARFTFTKNGSRWTINRVEYLPTLIDLGPPIRLVELTRDNGAVTPERRAQALERTDSVVAARGALREGLTRPGR